MLFLPFLFFYTNFLSIMWKILMVNSIPISLEYILTVCISFSFSINILMLSWLGNFISPASFLLHQFHFHNVIDFNGKFHSCIVVLYWHSVHYLLIQIFLFFLVLVIFLQLVFFYNNVIFSVWLILRANSIPISWVYILMVCISFSFTLNILMLSWFGNSISPVVFFFFFTPILVPTCDRF